MITRKFFFSFLLVTVSAVQGTAYAQTQSAEAKMLAILTAKVQDIQNNMVPAGTVVAFAGSQAPKGWLLCDGSVKSKSQFEKLYNAIGYAHGGSGDTFNLPDYRGRFLRGVDGGTGRDPDAAARFAMAPGGNAGNQPGSVQASAFTKHSHSGSIGSMDRNATHSHGYESVAWTSVQNFNAAQYWPSPVYPSYVGKQTNEVNLDHSHSLTIQDNGSSSESRPVNAYVNYIIKY